MFGNTLVFVSILCVLGLVSSQDGEYSLSNMPIRIALFDVALCVAKPIP